MTVEYPPALSGGFESQVSQIRSYLYRMAEYLNVALQQVDGKIQQVGTDVRTQLQAVSQEEKAEEYFSALRENIVKTADLIQVARDEIEQELHTSYYAKGDSAELYADIQTQVTATAESVVMNYDYNETILADVNGSLEALEADAALLNQFKVHTEGFIRSGIVAWEDNVPIFGIAIGQNLVHKETQYEGNTYDDLTDNANVAYYTATGITFTVAGQKVATFDQQKMQVEGIEVGTYLLMDENWQWSTAGGSLALKWIGG